MLALPGRLRVLVKMQVGLHVIHMIDVKMYVSAEFICPYNGKALSVRLPVNYASINAM